tara:strand:- start:272 stop:499 length:228 start_codon:yes stop_codon:yes gene_type:complete
MPIDPDDFADRILLNRINNLEERVRDLMTAHQRFVSMMEVQELLVATSTDLANVKEIIVSLNNRVAILEDIPPGD